MPAKRFKILGRRCLRIVANFIIAAAKNGERDAGRLYKQVLADYGHRRYVDAAYRRGRHSPCLRSGHAPSVIKRRASSPEPGFRLISLGTRGDVFRFKLSVRIYP